MIYYYETHFGKITRTMTEENDKTAMKKLRYEYGERLDKVDVVYVLEENGSKRIVWSHIQLGTVFD